MPTPSQTNAAATSDNAQFRKVTFTSSDLCGLDRVSLNVQFVDVGQDVSKSSGNPQVAPAQPLLDDDVDRQ